MKTYEITYRVRNIFNLEQEGRIVETSIIGADSKKMAEKLIIESNNNAEILSTTELGESNIFNSIRRWGYERNLQNANPDKQIIKLLEELGELSVAYQKKDTKEMIDALGDITVVLTILAMQLGFNLEDCLDQAYKVIEHRKGKIENGMFVKEE